MAKWTADKISEQTDKVIVVTGANAGIGYHTALELSKAGAHVVLACRSEKRANAALEKMKSDGAPSVEYLNLDLSDLANVEKFSNQINDKFDRLDILINNAGVMIPPATSTADGFELQIGVNHLGHFALTQRLFPLLSSTANSRVVSVSSMAHRQGKIDKKYWKTENGYKPIREYAQSKLANLMFAIEFDRRLEAAGSETLSVAAHPGGTKTDLARHNGLVSALASAFAMKAWQGALPTLFAATEPLEGGAYIGPRGVMEMLGYPGNASIDKKAHDESVAKQLWVDSEEAVGLKFEI